jgi:hypothetical protein
MNSSQATADSQRTYMSSHPGSGTVPSLNKGGIGVSPQARECREVPQQLTCINEALEDLAHSIGDLTACLSSIIVSVPQALYPESVSAMQSNLGKDLCDIAQRIRNQKDRITTLHNTVQI